MVMTKDACCEGTPLSVKMSGRLVLPPPIAIEIKKNAANNVQKARRVSADFTDNPGVLSS
jgi:hypothetical protein